MAEPPPAAPPAEYPLNIAETHKSRYALTTYHERLGKEGPKIFQKNQTQHVLYFWDLPDDGTGSPPSPVRVSSWDDLEVAMKSQGPPRRCRFIFLMTAGSRGPLRCSREQLGAILSHHRVMPSFLDFCFEFRRRERALSTCRFRVEDCVRGERTARIQHMFNVFAFEDNKDPGSQEKYRWPLRHVTAYHSFDVDTGASLWLVIKGDETMRERIVASPHHGEDANPAPGDHRPASFGASLRTHIAILEWCTENWSSYIGYLEERYHRYATDVKHAPVGELAASMANRAAVEREPKSPFGPSLRRATQNSHVSWAPSPGSNQIARILGGWRNTDPGLHHPSPIGNAPPPAETAEEDNSQEGEDEVEDVFPFEDLQSIRGLSDEVAAASTVLDQDKRILGDLRRRYSTLVENLDFVEGMGGRPIRAATAEFLQQAEVLEGDLDAHRCRITALTGSLDKAEEMFKGIRQYVDSLTAQQFAKASQDSARMMQKWAERTHEVAAKTEKETVSMHVITGLTLVFLPGTFVSTIFGSGMMVFHEETSVTNKLGDWGVKWPAVWLFLVLCLPIMAATLFAWWITYRIVKKQDKMAMAPEELPNLTA